MNIEAKYYEGNDRLGPAVLRDVKCPHALLLGYQRFGNLSSSEFLRKWRILTDEGMQWAWPNRDDEGFLLNNSDRPIAGEITLQRGDLVDRWGIENTPYFSPLATPYAMRSLPPSALNLPYSVYEIKKPMKVLAGPIAPGFEQPGLGTQYVTHIKPHELYSGKWIRKLSDEEVKELFKDY